MSDSPVAPRAIHLALIGPAVTIALQGRDDPILVVTIEYGRPVPWAVTNRALHQLLVELCAEFEQTTTGNALAKALATFDAECEACA